ncbi:MAG: glutamine-hydrolyzing GMP synthase, partial [Pseudomonadota bacterium]|nr:glutamine-hydrolyzing GMP synthase [Pseudomonadota bacterium]
MTLDIHRDRLLILDFGSQYTQLIARRIREVGVYCEIMPWDVAEEEIISLSPSGVILSGGPESVTEPNSPRAPDVVFNLEVPILGICYGMQTMAAQLGGAVEGSATSEFGYAQIRRTMTDGLFDDLSDDIDSSGQQLLDVWMSHGDKVSQLPPDFELTAETGSCPIAGMAHRDKPWFGIQFHPEVTHTLKGEEIFRHFVLSICGCEALWTPANIVEDAIARVRDQVGDDNVLLGLSGGVDSSVVAALLHRAIGDQLTCVFVDNGLL